MLYKEIICPVCNGHGFLSGGDDHSVWSKPCPNHCHNGLIVVPVTNGDLIRRCTNEQLVKVHINLNQEAIYSDSEHKRLLSDTLEDFALWLDKETDDLDLRTIFDFINEKDFEHPWIKGN